MPKLISLILHTFLLTALLASVSSCSLETGATPGSGFEAIGGECFFDQEFGEFSQDTCLLKTIEQAAIKPTTRYSFTVTFLEKTNSFVEFFFRADRNLGEGLALRIKRSGNIMTFSIRDLYTDESKGIDSEISIDSANNSDLPNLSESISMVLIHTVGDRSELTLRNSDGTSYFTLPEDIVNGNFNDFSVSKPAENFIGASLKRAAIKGLLAR